MSKLGEAWAALDDDTKNRFKVTADEAKAKFKEEHGEGALAFSKNKKQK